ncbi:hypothetical protein HWV62_8231 [Athelia sp. TMB]|nr:hypothetical protein HWV62_8231 [Athelia sp. TMB]
MRSFFQSLLALTFLAVAVVAEPSLSPFVLHEKRDHIPVGWAQHRRHDLQAKLPLRFGLSQANLESMEHFLNDVSHPNSPNYGKHWSAHEVAEKFAPSSDTIETVRAWLMQSGIGPERIRLTKAKTWIEVDATVEEAEALLNTEYHVYKHASGKEHVSCTAYHLPAHVTPHVELVTPTLHFNTMIARGPEPGTEKRSHVGLGTPGQGFNGPKTTGGISTLFDELEDCDKQITPTCLRALYGLVYEPLSASKNSYGIVEYTPQAYVASDLDNFAKKYAAGNVGKRPTLTSIDGGFVQTDQTSFDYNGESNLDLEYGMALVTDKQPVTLYQVGDAVEGGSFNNFLDALDGSYCTFDGGDDPSQDGIYPDTNGGYQGVQACGTVKPANVISTSYSYNEADLTAFYTARQCNEYAKLGLLGVTILYSSGDNGVSGNGGLCLNPDKSQTAGGELFNPTFPGSCPFVTAVGATQINPGKTVNEPESACEQVIYSGGGFSNYFAMPGYQASQVKSYLTNTPPPYTSAQYNNSGTSRGYPDLSANGANYAVAVDGNFSLVYGTSASAPVVGAILTMVNDARITVGKAPIGFINPTIYSPDFACAFNDITSGTNPGCGTVGFSAVKGWDPVTGLGTPNFPKLVAKWLLMD